MKKKEFYTVPVSEVILITYAESVCTKASSSAISNYGVVSDDNLDWDD